MMNKRFTESQIVALLKEAEAGNMKVWTLADNSLT